MDTRNMDDTDERLMRRPRYAGVEIRKSAGATYTPAALADFVAQQMLRVATLPRRGSIRVLDPAAGDGALLDALITALPATLRKRLQVRGYDIDQPALAQANERLRRDHPDVDMLLEQADFLDVVSRPPNGTPTRRFDLVIANPPYVRTQIMGAQQAQQLARQFGLTGRVDLYYPFLLGISRVLGEDGVAGVITSNRF
ncbi:MAG TPA: N-6 DNA methylase, partial [Dokdonella sp.]|uniref:Eco57I restriction-modification methylase domain-containing protein n=1 Tax=Dokdonella sp. TaxID=2291710 RepID=UPI002D7EF618